MLHLFNKVYVEFDDKIEINFDRVVISERYGIQMNVQLNKIAYGELIAFGKSYEEVINVDFVGFLGGLKEFSEKSGKKIIIYCDKQNYKKFVTRWFKTILPNLTFDSFKTIIEYTMYNERIVSNSQLSSVYSVDLTSLWEGVGSLEEMWDSAPFPGNSEREVFENLNLNHSYEFLLSSHLAGDTKHHDSFKKTVHMFLRRWYTEILADNRQMVLLNINNHRMHSSLGIDSSLIDVTKIDPLDNIEQLSSYSDDEIWERDQNQYGLCKLEGLSETKAHKLMETLIQVHESFEGMSVDRSVYSLKEYIVDACDSSISDDRLNELIDYVVENPFDTCLVPRFDFQNVNFPLMQHFISQKHKGADLSDYRLL